MSRDFPIRKNMRLKYYDYSQHGLYYVTICTLGMVCLFGKVVNNKMELNELGKVVENRWNDLPKQYPNSDFDTHIVMPNHFHGIICLQRRGEVSPPANFNKITGRETKIIMGKETLPLHRRKPKLGQIVAYFKYNTTKLMNKRLKSPGMSIWQRNYHDRIIRNEKDYVTIREYIKLNPERWEVAKM